MLYIHDFSPLFLPFFLLLPLPLMGKENFEEEWSTRHNFTGKQAQIELKQEKWVEWRRERDNLCAETHALNEREKERERERRGREREWKSFLCEETGRVKSSRQINLRENDLVLQKCPSSLHFLKGKNINILVIRREIKKWDDFYGPILCWLFAFETVTVSAKDRYSSGEQMQPTN